MVRVPQRRVDCFSPVMISVDGLWSIWMLAGVHTSVCLLAAFISLIGSHPGGWDKTSCHRFEANEARLKMGFLAYNLLHLIRRFYLLGEDTRRSTEWIIMRLVKVGARIVYHARYGYVHVASAFPSAHHYRAVLGSQH